MEGWIWGIVGLWNPAPWFRIKWELVSWLKNCFKMTNLKTPIKCQIIQNWFWHDPYSSFDWNSAPSLNFFVFCFPKPFRILNLKHFLCDWAVSLMIMHLYKFFFSFQHQQNHKKLLKSRREKPLLHLWDTGTCFLNLNINS